MEFDGKCVLFFLRSFHLLIFEKGNFPRWKIKVVVIQLENVLKVVTYSA